MVREETERFFERPLGNVAREFAASYMYHEARKAKKSRKDQTDVFKGESAIIGLIKDIQIRGFYQVEQVILYTSAYTEGRWPNERSQTIFGMAPGEVIAYAFRGTVNEYIKTTDAANIQLYRLRKVDNNGLPIPADEAVLTSSQIAPILGLEDKGLARIHAIGEFRGRRAFLLEPSTRVLSDRQIQLLLSEFLGDPVR